MPSLPVVTPRRLPFAGPDRSFEEVVRHALHRIEAVQDLNIYLEVFADEALAQARRLDQKKAAGEPLGPLAGWVISIKDNICYAGHRCGAASKILEGFRSVYSATAVERLLAADAIIIGRTNCDEFAMGSSNENSAYGPVRNPLAPDRVPGGSSGGAAASVAAGTCHAALGSDTGGSIRQPAAFCGVVGMKPSYGRVSRYGLIAYGSSLDQIGPLAPSVDEAARILNIISGPDDYDASARPDRITCDPVEPRRPQRMAVLRSFAEHPALHPAVRAAVQWVTERCEAAGTTVDAVDFPFVDYLIPTYQVIATAEASSNLARYAGMLYGRRATGYDDLGSMIRRSRSEGFGPEVKRRIMLGTFVLSSGYYEAYFEKAAKVRRRIHQFFESIWRTYPVVLLPTVPGPPFRIGEISDPLQMYAQDLFVVLANLIGAPAVSVPVGTDSEGLPTAIQLMAAPGHDVELLEVARWIEKDVLVSVNEIS